MVRKFKTSCTKESLKPIRTFVSETLSFMAIDEIQTNLLVLAVDEICANRIIHSNNNDHRLFLEVIIRSDEKGALVFEVIDAGIPYDPSSYQEPSLVKLIQDRKKGGVGLMMVKRIMDDIEVVSNNDLFIFRMYKKLPMAS